MKRLLRGVALTMAVGVLALGTDAQAGKRHHGSMGSCGSSGGSHGSHGSSGGSWGSHGSSGGSRGSSDGSRGSRGSRGSSGGSRGSYGSCGSSGGSYGSAGSQGVVYVQPVHHVVTPTVQRVNCPGGVCPLTSTQSKPATVTTVPDATHAFLVVEVPADATVFLAGQRMSMTGTSRVFRIPTKIAGEEYAYPITVEVTREGETRKIEHTGKVVSGRTHTVRINENVEQQLVAVATL